MGRKFGRTSPPLARLPALQPAPRKALPPVIRAAVKLFDRQDGEGVDWRIMAEILFFAAFDALDRLPDDQRHLVAKRVDRSKPSLTHGIGTTAPSKPLTK